MRRPDQFPARASRSERVGAGVVASGCLGVLGVAAWLTPSAEGHGTHESLGLPACAWVSLFDRPCPTCGMTTAFSHAADGSYLSAFTTQPVGGLLALLAASVFWVCLHTATFGSRLGQMAVSLLGGRFLIVGGLALLGAWAYKVATW